MKKKMIHFDEFEMKLICSAVEYSHDTWQEWSEHDMSSIGFDERTVELMAQGYQMLLEKLKKAYPDHYAPIEDELDEEIQPKEVDKVPDNVIKFPVKTSNRDPE